MTINKTKKLIKFDITEELLSNTIELIRLFCFTTLPDRPGSLLSEIFLPIAGLVPGLLEAFKQLSSDSDDAHSDKMLKIIENWLRTFTIILETDFVIIVEDFENIVEVLSRILRPYKDINNLVSMSNDETNYIHDCVEIIHWFQKNHKRLDEPVIQMIVTILYELRGGMPISLYYNIFLRSFYARFNIYHIHFFSFCKHSCQMRER